MLISVLGDPHRVGKDLTSLAVLLEMGEANLPGPLTWVEGWLIRRARSPRGRACAAELLARYGCDVPEAPAPAVQLSA
ncbi:MAG: hypothetical protein KC502_19315 [Myxococcales bacterium]|nr:hypothetical protein [Myxococcales bacterium]